MQDAQGLRLGPGQGSVQGEQAEPGQQGRGGQGGGLPGLVHRQRAGRVLADSAVFPGADGVFDPGMHPVDGVDVGVLAPPAARGGGQVGYPQRVAPAVFSFEQGELRAGVRPLTAGEQAHARGPAGQLVPSGALAQQAGQLGDVRFFDPAPAVGAFHVAARAIGAALADFTVGIDCDLPAPRRDGGDRGPLACAEFPADGVDDLVAGPGGEGVQAGVAAQVARGVDDGLDPHGAAVLEVLLDPRMLAGQVEHDAAGVGTDGGPVDRSAEGARGVAADAAGEDNLHVGRAADVKVVADQRLEEQQCWKEGIAFTALDNAFGTVSDPAAVQRICDGLTDQKIYRFAGKWLARLPQPFTRADEDADYRWQLPDGQAGFSTTMALDRPLAGRIFSGQLIRDNPGIGRPDKVNIVFGRMIRQRGKFRTPGPSAPR